MASIEKLEIRGIRAFSPDANSVIEFYSPLTMIIGANGCGKTTVIESLKFVCSGVLPPNTKSGQSFVNDPQMTDASEIRAHVKLRFQNRRGYDCVATRNLQITRKKNKLEFKALDSVLKTVDDRGEVSSISMKCSELDRQIPDYLGVSSAVMENVIFCHQEESDWPMMDGASVKKRFDDIFDSTRYSKALEAIHKTKKELVDTTKQLKMDYAELHERLRTAETYREESKTTAEEVETTEREVQALIDRCEQYSTKIKDLKQVVHRQMGGRSELENLQLRITETQKRVTEKENSLDIVYTDSSDAELQSNLDNFDAKTLTKKNELREIQQTIDRNTAKVQTLRDSIVDSSSKLATLEMMSQQLEQLILQQKEQFSTIGKKHNIPVQVKTYNEFRPIFDSKVFQSKEDTAKELESVRSRAKADQKLLTEKTNVDQRLEIELNLHSNEIKKLSQDISDKRIQLTILSSAQKDMEIAQREFDEALANHDDNQTAWLAKGADLKKQFKECNQKLVDIEEQYSADDQLLQDLSLNRQETAMISALDKRLEEDTGSVKTDLMSLFSHRHVFMERIRPELPFGLNFTTAPSKIDDVEKLRTFIDEKTSVIKSSNLELTAESRRIERERDKYKALLETENGRLESLRYKHQSLSTKMNQWGGLFFEAKGLENELLKFMDIKDQLDIDLLPDTSDQTTLERVNEYVNSIVTNMKDLIGVFSALKAVKKKLLSKKAKNNMCPICSQGLDSLPNGHFEQTSATFLDSCFKNNFDSDDHASEMTIRWESISTKLAPFLKNVEPLEEIKAEIDSAVEKIDELRSKLADAEARDDTNSTLLSASSDDLSQFDGSLTELTEILNRWRGLDIKRQELQEKKRRQTQSLASFGSSDRSFEEIDQAQRQRREEKDDLHKRKEKIRNEEDNLNKRFNVVKVILQEKEKAVSDCRFKGAKHADLDKSINSLQSELDVANTKVKTIARDREDLKKVLIECTANSKKSQADLQQLEDKDRANNISFSTDGEALFRSQENIEKQRAKVSSEDIARLKQLITTNQRDVSSTEELNRTYTPQYNTCLQELSNQERSKKTYSGNIELRRAKSELQELRSAHQLKVSSMGADENKLQQAQRDLQKLEQDAQLAATKRDKLQGRLESLLQQQQVLTSKLESSHFLGIDEKHRRKTIEVETTQLATADLDNYYNALDTALQSFHTQKIKEINKIIRELWQLIYKGEDIDMIEVESGQEAGAAASAKGSRSYNYRVVMRKGNIPLDMRGRCSAGQRVLASIVIRLALAETFCLNCGILALDEPTTNLDERNKLGLASALARIIQSRSKQQNFQLICITHDEDFLRNMNMELSSSVGFSKPEHYFRIARVEDGRSGRYFSKIERVAWDEMQG